MRTTLTSRCSCLFLLLGGTVLLAVPVLFAEETSSTDRSISVGVSGELFRDVPASIISAMSQPFSKAMATETGMSGELVKVNDTLDLAQRLVDDRVQLAICTGYELAWARQKFPMLKPLALAVSGPERPQVLVIVPKESKVKCWGDLKGVALSRPRASRPHALLVLERHVQEPKQFFHCVNLKGEAIEALDDVAEGTAQAALVDNVLWESYQQTKPKRCARLRVAIESEKFPPSVVTWCPGNLDDRTVQKFRQGMLNANEDPIGKHLMSLWKMTGFQEVPADYEESLREIVKAYPAPEAKAKKD
jgi:ABC-type phosphate/phosphonate transport system substrate-binding protein